VVVVRVLRPASSCSVSACCFYTYYPVFNTASQLEDDIAGHVAPQRMFRYILSTWGVLGWGNMCTEDHAIQH
jgi:hypothetical protein